MKPFILAARPKTLIVSLAPPIVCFIYSSSFMPNIPKYLLFCALFSGMFIQMATNFFNDLIDHQKGSDSVRLGPQRMTASGVVSEKTMKSWAYGSLLIALILAVPLVYRGGPIILSLGLISLYLSYGYTGGIVSLAYRGLGELFVFLFFGLFSFMGCQYIYTLTFSVQGLVLASQFGLLAVTFICINNLRDRALDRKAGKLTLATRMSEKKYRFLIIVTILLPYFLSLITTHGFGLGYFGLLFGIPFCRMVYKMEGSKLNEGLKFSALHLILFSILTIMDITNGSIF